MVNGRPRLCIVTEDLSLPLDDDVKKSVWSLCEALRRYVVVETVSPGARGPVPPGVCGLHVNRHLVSLDFWAQLRAIDPQVLVYVPAAGATRESFLRLRTMQAYAPGARTVLLSLRTCRYGPLHRPLLRHLQPHLVLAQSETAAAALRSAGVPAETVPPGAEVERHTPLSPSRRRAVRARYGWAPDDFVVLHIGPQEGRGNSILLNRLRTELGCATLLIVEGAPTVPVSDWVETQTALQVGGTQVMDGAGEALDEVFAAADCYLYPTPATLATTDAPLTVFAALASGTPVVTTPVGDLPALFAGRTGVLVAADDDGLVAGVRRLRAECPDGHTLRAAVAPFTWEAMALHLLARVLGDRPDPAAPSSPLPQETTRGIAR